MLAQFDAGRASRGLTGVFEGLTLQISQDSNIRSQTHEFSFTKPTQTTLL